MFVAVMPVHTQKCQQQTGRILLNVRMAAAIGKALCANLRVNTKTAHGWVKSGAQERRPHAGGRRKALTEEQVDAICGMIEEDQGITLKALKERILADFQLDVAISTIHNYLEGRLLTLKKVHYIAADANNAKCKK